MPAASTPFVAVILSGGAGTRLWPVSRESHPKPFIRLADGQSLLQKTFLRALAQPGMSEVVTVTHRELYFQTRDQYRGVAPDAAALRFLLEPQGRNTAPAIALAALDVAARLGENAVLLVMPADHLVEDVPAFTRAVNAARAAAGTGKLVTFGIVPDYPESGFGYIEAGDALADGSTREVMRFVEKPTLDRAREFVASGRYLWNSGMFCFTAGALLAELGRQAPDVLAAARACRDASPAADAEGRVALDEATVARMPEDSIDYAVMERSHEVVVVPGSFGWSDVGTWNAVSRLVEADATGNATTGEVVMIDTADCYVQSEHRVVATVGVKNLFVVDTADALLVADRGHAQDVKRVVQELKARGHETWRTHRTVVRPWGTYTVLEEGPNFKIKRIVVKPGASLSLQRHRHRSEHWVVVSGTAQVTHETGELTVATNESTFIPAGHRHRLANPGAGDLVIIEVQSGSYLGEDDIERLDDAYGRR